MQKIEMHCKTKYSMDHESTIDIKNLILKCVENGEKAVALVDNDSVLSFSKAEKNLKELNIKDFKLIYGVEITIEYLSKKYKVVVLIKNKKGISKLYRVLSPYWINRTIVLDELLQYRENFVIGLLYDEENYNDELLQYFDYIEVDKNVAKSDIKKLKKQIMVVYSNRINALSNEEDLSKKILYYKLNIKKELDNRIYQNTEELLNETNDEEIVITNPNKIANMIDKFEIVDDEMLMPNNDDFSIDLLVYMNLNKRYKKRIPSKIVDRVTEELELIHKYNYDGFINLYKKIIDKCKSDNNEYVIDDYINYLYIAYLLGLTHFDSIKLNLNYDMFFSNYPKINIQVSDYYINDLLKYVKNDLGVKTIKCKGLMKLNNYMINMTIDKYEEKNNIKLTDSEKRSITKYLDDYPINNRAITSKEFILPNNFNVFELSPRELLNNGNSYYRFLNIDYKDIEHKFITLEITSNDKITNLNELKELTSDSINNCNYQDKNIINGKEFKDHLNIYDNALILDDLYEELIDNNVELPDVFNIINEIRKNKIISKATKNILVKNNIKLKRYHDINFISKGIINERVKLEYELLYFKFYYPIEYYYVLLKDCFMADIIDVVKNGYDEVITCLEKYAKYRYEYKILSIVKALYESNIGFEVEERIIIEDFCFELDKENNQIKLLINKDNKIVNEYLNNDISIIGTRPCNGKMNYLSKMLHKLLDKDKKIMLFGFGAPTTYYVEHLLSEITGNEKRNIHQYLNPCSNEIDELLTINQDELFWGIRYLLIHDLKIQDYHSVNDLVIEGADALLDKILKIISDNNDEIIIIDNINCIYDTLEKVLSNFKKIAKENNIHFIIFNNLKREYEENKMKDISSFENEKIMKKYISYISILENEEVYEIEV